MSARHSAFAAALTMAVAFASTASRADDTGDAKAVYTLGKNAYDRGSYEEALALFTRAYALRPAPALLFDMAQASRLSGKGHCAESLQLYERYLEHDPKAENRTEVEERIAQMRACAASEEPAVAAFPPVAPPVAPVSESARSEPSPASAPAPPEAPKSTPSRHSPPLAAVLTTGIGASLAIVGGILYLRARSKFEDAKATCPCPEGTYSDWQTLTTVSYGLMATGVVASGTGAAFWIFSGGSDTPDAKPNGAGVRFSGRF